MGPLRSPMHMQLRVDSLQIEKLGIWDLDSKWKFMVFKLAIDDVEDEFWGCTETEIEAQKSVEN